MAVCEGDMQLKITSDSESSNLDSSSISVSSVEQNLRANVKSDSILEMDNLRPISDASSSKKCVDDLCEPDQKRRRLSID